jgi:GntR family transcriptional regulator
MAITANPSLTVVPAEPGQSRYAALAAALRARVVAGEWPPGSALPAEQTLAAEHGVALGTLRRALELLADQGLIERIHGRGTFVRAGMTGGTMMRFFRFGEGTGEVPASHIVSRQLLARPPRWRAAWAWRAATRRCGCNACARSRASPVFMRKSGCRRRLFAGLAEGDAADLGRPALPDVCRALRRARGPRGR